MSTVMDDRVDVIPFQQAFEKTGLTPREVARAAEWFADGRPDGTRVLRTLGIRPTNKHGVQAFNRSMLYGSAVTLVRAMGLDPVDFKEWGL